MAAGYTVINDVLPEDRFKMLAKQLESGWKFGWKSNPKKDQFSFFNQHFAGNILPDFSKGGEQYECSKELKEVSPLIGIIWEQYIKRFTDNDDYLVRCYANAYPYGCDGTLHLDSVDSTSKTIILYPNTEWNPNWGGETVFFYDNMEDILFSCYPRPNRILSFPGNILHVARGVSRSCPLLRTTLMFKTQKSVPR